MTPFVTEHYTISKALYRHSGSFTVLPTCSFWVSTNNQHALSYWPWNRCISLFCCSHIIKNSGMRSQGGSYCITKSFRENTVIEKIVFAMMNIYKIFNFSYILSISVFKEVTNNSSSFMSFGDIFNQGKFCLWRCWDVMGRFVLEHCVCYSLMKTICFCGIVYSIGTRCILCITLIQSQIVNNWRRHEKRNNDKKRRHICIV